MEKKQHLNEIALAQLVATGKPGECPYSLFLGAGTSASAGLETAGGMVRQWQKLAMQMQLNLTEEPSEEDFKIWLENEYLNWKRENLDENAQDYSGLFEYFYKHTAERQLYLEQVLDKERTSFGYLYLAGLIHARRFDRILTTNFDDLVNETLTRYYGIKPIVCAFDSAVASIRMSSTRPKIIKLHGDFLFNSMRNASHELRRLSINMEDKLYQSCQESGLIVVGYSGNDESIMGPLHDMLRKQEYLNMGLHWCTIADTEGKPMIPEQVRDFQKNYGDRISIYTIDSFDHLMERMFLKCGCCLPAALVDPHSHNPAKGFYYAIRDGSSSKLSPGMTSHLAEVIEGAEQDEDKSEYSVIKADLLFENALHAREAGQLSKAAQKFIKSLEYVDKFLRSDNQTTELTIRALRRKVGVCIGIAKTQLRTDSLTEFDKFIAEALKSINDGLRLCNSPHGQHIPSPTRRSFHYNRCCMYGVVYGLKRNLTTEQTTQLRSDVLEIKRLDPSGAHLRKLCRDSDFQPVKHLVKDLLE